MTDGREERGDRTRETLLLAARRTFARRGYAGASVRDLAAEAGVNPALVGYHFGSKEGLWKAVVDEAMAGVRQRITVALAAACDPRDAVRRALGAYLDHLAEDPDVPRLIQRGLLDGDAHVAAIVTAHLRPLLDALATIAGPARPLGDPRESAVSLFGAAVAPVLYAPVLSALRGEDPLAAPALARRREHLDALVDLVLRTHLESP